jgi:hypothetical protein
MQTLDTRFLNNLKEKLVIGNRSSIYLNALPGRYLTRLDLADLNVLQEDMAEYFLESLLTKSQFSFPIEPNLGNTIDSEKEDTVIRRLSSITIENEDYYEEHGTKTFGFGYPIMLIKDPKDPSKIIKAPLIIWSLNIQRNLKQENQWVIKREEDFSVTTNMGLTSFLRKQANIVLQPMYDQMLEDSILDKDELAEMAHLHMKQLNPKISDRTKTLFRKVLDSKVAPIKSLKEIETLPLDSPAILWSGVFGLYRSQKDNIVKDLDLFIKNIAQLQPLVEQEPNPSDPSKSSFMKHSFTMLKTDPSQQHLLHSLDKGNNLVIQGPPGTGKSQTLTGIIANTLSNAGTCLVVCEKKTALDVIYNMLKKIGIEELAIVVEDVYRDRLPLVDSVRRRAQHQHQPYRVSPTFIRLLQSSAAHIVRLQGFHKKMQEPITGDHNWANTVGHFLDSNKKNDKDILASLLKASQFEFKSTEYDDIISILSEGEALFKPLGTLNHPLNAMHDRFFRQANATQVETDTKKALDSISKVVNSAQRDILTYLFEYEQLLEEHYSQIYLAKMKLADRVSDIIEGGLAQSKYYFNKRSGVYGKLMSRFSDKHQKSKSEKIDALESFFRLQKLQKQYSYFKYQFMDTSDHKKLDFAKLLEHVNEYKAQVYDWYDARTSVIQQLVKELGPGKIYKYVSFSKRVNEVTKNLDTFETNFAQSNVFKVGFKFASKTIRKRLTQIEGLDENLQKLKNEFDDFAEYHALKFFWLSLDTKQQAAFQALTKANPKNWAGSFSSWYLHTALAQHEDKFVPDGDQYSNTRNSFVRELTSLQEMLTGHTLKYWRGKQSQSVQAFHKQKAPLTLHSLYNTRSNNSGQRTPLRKIIEASPEVFTSFFPVLLVSPAVCSSILPLYPGLFDVVIFDEASQLNLEETFSALVRGKYKIISGDSHQLPPPNSFQAHHNDKEDQGALMNEEDWDNNSDMVSESIDYLSSSASLLEYALSEGTYKESFLEVHYRSKHPYLIDFSNAAFYGNRLTSFPAQTNYVPIEFKEIGGTYTNYSNIKEASEIINYLLELVSNDSPCPSVGIATFNLHQRNLILEQIQQKTIQDPAAGSKLQLLMSNGLFVKNLENIQGEERDILVISTTFGIRADGAMPQKFGPINHQDGYKLLNVIITRAKEKVCVFNSIPSAYYEGYRQEIIKKGNTGKGIFYAYLAYAKAVSDQNDSIRQSILKLIFEHCNKKPVAPFLYNPKDDLFEVQVINFLTTEFPNLVVKTKFHHGGFILPIAVLNEQEDVIIAFYFDVFHDQYSEEAYAWDIFHEQYLKKMGIACYRIWSKEWWENLHQAQQKLTIQVLDVIG